MPKAYQLANNYLSNHTSEWGQHFDSEHHDSCAHKRRGCAWHRVAVCSLLAIGAASIARAEENPWGLKVHHVTASVLDMERATRWYRDKLGFKVVDQGTRQNGAFKYAVLKIPGFGIALLQTGSAATPSAESTARPSWVHIVFSVSDPNRTFEEMKQRGLDVTIHPGDDATHLTSFLIHDSEGNEIEIVSADLP